MSISTVYDDVVASVYDDVAIEDPYGPMVEEPEAADATVTPKAKAKRKAIGKRRPKRKAKPKAEIAAEEAPVAEEVEAPLVEEEPQEEPLEAEVELEAQIAEAEVQEAAQVEGKAKGKGKRRPKRKAKRPRQDIEAPEALSEEEKLAALQRQIEYYFSDKNLRSDEFFHEKISENAEGWLDSSWILGCNRVKKLGVSNEEDIESALLYSEELDFQWVALEGQRTLQVRRKEGRALPELEVAQPMLRPGWLAKQVESRKQSYEVEAPTELQVPQVGATVKLMAGEHAGESAQVMAVDGEELTLLVAGADVVIASAREVETPS